MNLWSLVPAVCLTSLLSSLHAPVLRAAEDVIHFRHNDVLRDKVLNEILEIATPYGDGKMALRTCAGVSFEGAQANTESLVTVNVSRIYVADGVRQVAALFGSLAPVQGESDGAAFATPSRGGRSFVNSIGMKFQLIPAGTFTMGSEDGNNYEKPVHEVEISKPFYMGVYEVTQSEYEAATGQNPSRNKGANNPVERVSWNEAVSFCAKLEEKERAAGKLPAGHQYRLPTEAEWEYACRAGGKGNWCFGNDESQSAQYAWYEVNSKGKTHPVGLKRASAWGLHDMHGNVWEWCKDWYGNYSPGKAKDPCNVASGSSRVLRGGSRDFIAFYCRSAYRYDFHPSYRDRDIGFRVVLAPGQP